MDDAHKYSISDELAVCQMVIVGVVALMEDCQGAAALQISFDRLKAALLIAGALPNNEGGLV